MGHDSASNKRKEPDMMDKNIAAWMIAGGPLVESHTETREREQLRAFREGQRRDHVGLIARLRAITRSSTPDTELACCPT
jgi:hypothetical protein